MLIFVNQLIFKLIIFPCYAGIFLFPLPSKSCPHMTLYWLLMRDITNKGLTVVC